MPCIRQITKKNLGVVCIFFNEKRLIGIRQNSSGNYSNCSYNNINRSSSRNNKVTLSLFPTWKQTGFLGFHMLFLLSASQDSFPSFFSSGSISLTRHLGSLDPERQICMTPVPTA